MKPTICRMVRFNHNGVMVPAVVQHVHEGGDRLRLFVMTRYSGEIRDDVTEGTEDGQWSWPPKALDVLRDQAREARTSGTTREWPAVVNGQGR